MADEIKLNLTQQQYKRHLENSLVEIKYFFEAYNELSDPTAINPATGQPINLAKLTNPLRKPAIISAGSLLLMASFCSSLYILKNQAGSPALSYLTWSTAIIGTLLLLPTLAFYFMSQVRHDRAKGQARFVADGVKKTYRPDLTKVTDELIMALFHDDSMLTIEIFMLMQNLEKDITSDDIAHLFNYIFNGDDVEVSHLVLDEKALIQSKTNFKKILEDGIGAANKTSYIEDPKFIQLITYSIAIHLLTNEYASGNLVGTFPALDNEKLKSLYEDFCAHFLNYCKQEYGEELYIDEVETRIMTCIIDLL